MSAKKLASAVTALALLVNATGAAAFQPFIEQDEIVMHFEGKKPGGIL